MKKDFEITFLIDDEQVGGSFLCVENGKLLTESAADEFFAVLRKNEKSLLKEAAEEEKSDMVEKLTPDQEEKLKEEHAKGYFGTDDDMPDAYEQFLEDLTSEEMKAILV